MAANAIKMPKLGMTMREGTVVDWPIPVGGAVDRGAIVLVIESEKAEVEIEAQDSGFLRHLYVERGDTVPCGTLLAALTDTADEPFDVEAFRAEHDTPEAAPAAAPRRAAPTEVATTAGLESTRRPVAPAAKARAKELGVDIDAVTGSGPGGRVTRADVDAHVAARASLLRVAEGVSLEVPSTGEGDEVLLLPGFGTDASSFAQQIKALAAHHRVRAVNPRGIGASDTGGDAPVTPRSVAEDAAALLTGPTHVIGASFGAAAAVELALARPELVRSLVLITPSLAPHARLFAVLDAWTRLVADAPADTVAAAMLPWLFSGRFLADPVQAERTARGFAAMTRRTPASTLRRYAEGLRRWASPDLGGVAAPTLVIAAEDDLLTPDAEAVAEAIPGASLVVVKDAGHALALEDPEEVTRAILEHLAGS